MSRFRLNDPGRVSPSRKFLSHHRGLLKILKSNQEIIIGSLLLATLALILANHFFVRTLTFDHANLSRVSSFNDSNEGGNSKTSVEIDEDVFKMNYDIDSQGHPTPYANFQFLLEEEAEDDLYKDLSWIDYFDIELRCDKPRGEQYLFIVRSFEPNVSKHDDANSTKFNESLVHATNEMSVVRVSQDEFLVPTWWKKRYNVQREDGHTSFKMTQSLELSTQGDVGSGVLEVRSIKCSGNWINTATLNQTLLWLWMAGTLIASLWRMLGLKRKLNEKTASALELLHHNNLLISESATYHELARRDPLTGLLNRYGLEGSFEKLTAATGGFSYTMILFDLDNFKNINDKHGHCYGDRVLFDIARIVKSKIGKSDIVARWGGDEFLIVLFDQNLNQAMESTEEIRQAVLISDLDYTLSFGISKSSSQDSFEETFSKADTALYDSKEKGRNTTNVFKHPREHVEVPAEVSGDVEDVEIPVVILPTLDSPSAAFSIFE